MLTDIQLEILCEKMNIPLEGIFFKSDLPNKFKFNKSYIINLDDEYNDDGTLNYGSHYCCLQINKNNNNEIQNIYFDSTNCPPPEIVKKIFLKTIKDYDIKQTNINYCKKNIQSVMADCCGWFCCAFLHYINAYENRTNNLYNDTEDFLNLFDDLDKSIDWKKNEYILKLFFQPKEKELRKDVNVLDIVNDDKERIDLTKF